MRHVFERNRARGIGLFTRRVIAAVATAAMTRRVNRPMPLALFRSKTCLIRLPPCTVKRSGKYLPPSTGIFDASSLHIPSDNRFVA